MFTDIFYVCRMDTRQNTHAPLDTANILDTDNMLDTSSVLRDSMISADTTVIDILQLHSKSHDKMQAKLQQLQLDMERLSFMVSRLYELKYHVAPKRNTV
jgi:hypothetical protein